MKFRIAAVIAVLGGLFCVAALEAQSVVMPKSATPEQVVASRKFAMRANNSNLRDIRLKIEKGDSDGLVTPALNLSAIAQLIPYVFVERYESVYPYGGSAKYFKGAPQEDVQAEAEYLNAQAQKLLTLAGAGKTSDLNGQLDRIKRACVSCHKKMRGE